MKRVSYRGAQAISFIGPASDTATEVEFNVIKDLLRLLNTATWEGEGLRMVDHFDYFEDAYFITALRLLDIKDVLLRIGWIEINDLNDANSEERFDALLFLKITEKGQDALKEMIHPDGHGPEMTLDARELMEGAPQA
jgi:hypothetical protein